MSYKYVPKEKPPPRDFNGDPCYDCAMYKRCGAQRISCLVFRQWITTGEWNDEHPRDPSTEINEQTIKIYADLVDGRSGELH